LTTVPAAMKAVDKSGIDWWCEKILIHQANEKMDEGIIQRFTNYERPVPRHHAMSIHELGNSSVATVLPYLIYQ
jgi:3-oxoacyl-[acyl-carrier-protein] synthase-3